MSSILKKYNVICNEGASSQIFESLFDGNPFTQIDYSSPSDYVRRYWAEYENSGERNASINGNIFELIIATLFIRENLLPLYLQAKVAFVPNVLYDALLYSPEFGPISLSMKTSLRERYKQADLEAIALKYVHRRAKSFLLTIDERNSRNVNFKIKNGDVIGLDQSIDCKSSQLDELISELRQHELSEAGSVEIIQSSLKITSDIYS